MSTSSAADETRSATINLRLQASARDLIDQAAAALGKSRTEFMVEAARKQAEAVLLDRRLFVLEAKAFSEFTKALDQPPGDNPRLRRLLRSSAPWD